MRIAASALCLGLLTGTGFGYLEQLAWDREKAEQARVIEQKRALRKAAERRAAEVRKIQLDSIPSLVTQMRAAIEAKQWEEAAGLARRIDAINPDVQEVAANRENIEEELNKIYTQRAEEQRRRAAAEQAERDRARVGTIMEMARAETASDGSRCRKASKARVESVTKQYGDWSNDMLVTVACGFISIGMTEDQVRASWGRPEDINRTVGSWGIHEQWVYGLGSYVYFEDGIVTSVQN